MAELIFGTQQHITVWQECARAVVVFVYGLLLIRLIGRRVFGKWSALDFIVAIMVGSALARTMTGSAPLGGTIAAVGLLMALHWMLAHFAARHAGFAKIVEGSPITLGRDGTVSKETMQANNITESDLGEALRGKSIEGLAETDLVSLEPSGKINVIPKVQPPSRNPG